VATISLGSSPNPSVYGGQVLLSAVVSPVSGTITPTGTVTFRDGSTNLGSSTLNASGVATLPTATLAAGTHTITAQYNGDSTYSGSTSAGLSQTVNKANTTTALTSNRNPSNPGQPVTFKATVSPSTATGTVQFFDGTTLLGTSTVNGGSASLSTSSLTAGPHAITAQYSGNSNYTGSTSAVLTETVGRKK